MSCARLAAGFLCLGTIREYISRFVFVLCLALNRTGQVLLKTSRMRNISGSSLELPCSWVRAQVFTAWRSLEEKKEEKILNPPEFPTRSSGRVT